MRCINADAPEKYLSDAEIEATRQRKYVFASALNTICGNVRNHPTIEPERKKGEWIRHPEQKNIFGGKTIECSECGEKYVVQYIKDEKFCRNCGADMREEGEQDA